MRHRVPLSCPACSTSMYITELSCPACNTRVQGAFEVSPLARLEAEQLKFVEVFLRCRGNIREVEKDLKISYPTVRSRLDNVIRSMGFPIGDGPDAESESQVTTRVLEALDQGELTFEEALAQLRKGEINHE